MATRSCLVGRSLLFRTAKSISVAPRAQVLSRRCAPQIRYYAQPAAEVDPPKGVRYTTDDHPEIKRDPRFAELTAEHVKFFRDVVGGGSAVIDGVTEDAADDLEGFNTDWMRKYRGKAQLVVKPGSTEEVSKVLAYCNKHKLAVVPQGGNTGLVGGSVPVADEVIISMSRMNRIRSFDEVSGILIADAGVILENADSYLAERHHLFPLDLGAKGSCHIGGNVATNAGGLRLLRYGSLHGNVLGLEAVLPDGTVMDDMQVALRKNNTGYDLKQLFIGGEGTLGIITGVAVLCPARPPARNVALFGLESYEQVQKAFGEAKRSLAEILSAFEMMDGRTQRIVGEVTGREHPLADKHPFYVLVETSGSDTAHDAAKLDAFLERVMESEIVTDGVVAQDETQAKTFWSWREGVPETLGHWGGVYKYDVSIPIADLYRLVDDTRARLQEKNLIGDSDEFPAIDSVGYGHMGDANIHLNVPVRRYDKAVEEALEPWVYEWIRERKGSISAEHGLGLAKKAYVGYSRDETMLKLMRQIKALWDPNGIMNPYKYI